MLGIGCPDRHALPFTVHASPTLPRIHNVLHAIRKADLSALTIEHLAHFDAVCRRSGFKGSADHRAKQSSVDMKHDWSKYFPAAMSVAGKSGTGHGYILSQTRPDAQQEQTGTSHAQAPNAIGELSHRIDLTEWRVTL
jgi:hypothetical protein